MQYLVKLNKEKRIIDQISVPKSTRLEKGVKGVRAVTRTMKGPWIKGYKLVNAKSSKQAYKKAFGLVVIKKP